MEAPPRLLMTTCSAPAPPTLPLLKVQITTTVMATGPIRCVFKLELRGRGARVEHDSEL